ncbi:MAG: ABC transporter ATP-binding protein [Vicinamibacterales bacterium]|nr:ABC transporter ATP-binding protein [Vicinamibacterales bacterium]
MTPVPNVSATDEVILALEELRVYFQTGGLSAIFGGRPPPIRAVDGVSFEIRRGQNLGLVGESGSGKTTVARTILRLERPTAGRVMFENEDVHAMSGRALNEFRKATHAVFQDPQASLSPRMRVRDVVGEPLAIQGTRGRALRERVDEVLELVGLTTDAARRYPHEFSGGQRQRIAVARAIASGPRLILLDEPVSALDVSIRAQILNLLRELQDRLDLTYLTIAHDLAVVYQACDVVAVMYLGKLVELGNPEDLYNEPAHPYSRILLSSIPQPDPKLRHRERLELTGEIPSPANPPSGCRFHPRCPIAIEKCAQDEPEWREIQPGRWVACHRTFES